MRELEYIFLIGAIVELLTGVLLLVVYNKQIGYMGLSASFLLILLTVFLN